MIIKKGAFLSVKESHGCLPSSTPTSPHPQRGVVLPWTNFQDNHWLSIF